MDNLALVVEFAHALVEPEDSRKWRMSVKLS